VGLLLGQRGTRQIVIRLLQRAVKFVSATPFINPSRAHPALVELSGNRYIIGKAPTQNAVFLTTGIVTECALVQPTESWSAAVGSTGPPVKRVKLMPFTAEFERAGAYFATFLDTPVAEEFGGPIYNNGLAFLSRKESANKGMKSPPHTRLTIFMVLNSGPLYVPIFLGTALLHPDGSSRLTPGKPPRTVGENGASKRHISAKHVI
jgi:hypothetical protein